MTEWCHEKTSLRQGMTLQSHQLSAFWDNVKKRFNYYLDRRSFLSNITSIILTDYTHIDENTYAGVIPSRF